MRQFKASPFSSHGSFGIGCESRRLGGVRKTLLTQSISLLFASSVCLAWAGASHAGGSVSFDEPSIAEKTDYAPHESKPQAYFEPRLILEFSDPLTKTWSSDKLKALVDETLHRNGIQGEFLDRLGKRFVRVQLPFARSAEDLDQAVSKLQKDASVLNAEAVQVALPRLAATPTSFNDPAWIGNFRAGFMQLFNPQAVPFEYYLEEMYMNFDGFAAGVEISLLDNGIIDNPDLRGRVSQSLNFVEGEDPLNAIDDDFQGTNPGLLHHGTVMHSALVARKNNSIGVVGLVDGASVGHLKIASTSTNNRATSDAMAKAILFSVGRLPLDQFEVSSTIVSDVIIIPYAGGAEDCPLVLQDAINEAVNAGALIVAPSYRDFVQDSEGVRRPVPLFPGNCKNVIAVGQSDANGNYNINSFTESDVATIVFFGGGPGIPGGQSSADDNRPNNFFPVFSQRDSDATSFTGVAGVSISSVLVGGIMAVAKKRNPDMNQGQAIEALKISGFPLGEGLDSNQASILDVKRFLERVALLDVTRDDNPSTPITNPLPPVDLDTGTGTGTGTDSGTGTGADSGTGQGAGTGTDAGTGAPAPTPPSAPNDQNQRILVLSAIPSFFSQIDTYQAGTERIELSQVLSNDLKSSSAQIINNQISVSLQDDGVYRVFFQAVPTSNSTVSPNAQNRVLTYTFLATRSGNSIRFGSLAEAVENQNGGVTVLDPGQVSSEDEDEAAGSMGLWGLLGLAGIAGIRRRMKRST